MDEGRAFLFGEGRLHLVGDPAVDIDHAVVEERLRGGGHGVELHGGEAHLGELRRRGLAAAPPFRRPSRRQARWWRRRACTGRRRSPAPMRWRGSATRRRAAAAPRARRFPAPDSRHRDRSRPTAPFPRAASGRWPRPSAYRRGRPSCVRPAPDREAHRPARRAADGSDRAHSGRDASSRRRAPRRCG